MDKFFLLTYTCIETDGRRHMRYAWFSSEEELRAFVADGQAGGQAVEVDLAIEILSHREIDL